MKKVLLLFLVSIFTINIYAQEYITLKVGESYSISGTDNARDSYLLSGGSISTSGISFGTNHYFSISIVAIAPGYGSFTSADKTKSGYAFYVQDVIPGNLDLLVSQNYTFSPVIDGSLKPLTWSSSNTSVATVNANGVLTGVSPGKTTITCKNKNGFSTKCEVTVNTRYVTSVTLNKKSYEMSVGGTYSLTATVMPDNATQKTVNWLSTNDNIAQVDENGKVTAIGSGYCSIIAIANDGSGKFAKCLIRVQGTAASRGDVNGDGDVTVTDAEAVIDMILSNP